MGVEGLRAGPFDSKRYALLACPELVVSLSNHCRGAQGKVRVESPELRAASSDRVRGLFDLVDLSNRGRRNGFPGKILPDFF